MSILVKRFYFIIGLLSFLALLNCGGSTGLGGLAGIGGSGFISTGTITSFGSVFVNGVEFDTDSSTYTIDDIDGSQVDLRIGMVVQVSGSINPDGVTGTATHINYAENLEGAVSNLITTAGGGKQFTILQQTVMVSEANTAFEGMAFIDIADDSVLEVSGYYNQEGMLKASYIKFKDANSSDATIFEIKGQIMQLSGTRFKLQGVDVDASGANLTGLPNGALANKLYVKVEGLVVNDVIIATLIKGQGSISVDDDVEIQGIITRYVSISDFDINDRTVNAENATILPPGLVLKVGVELEADGRVVNEILIASQIEARDGASGVNAKVVSGSIDLVNNRFSVEVLPGQLVSVQLTSSTLLVDDAGDNDSLLLSELNVDDFVEVKGFESGAGLITATRVKRNDEVSKTKLQGKVTATTINSFTVLGVTYPIDFNTSYGKNSVFSYIEFITLLTLNQTLIRVTNDNPADEIADEIVIED